jgi:hypothetical protein
MKSPGERDPVDGRLDDEAGENTERGQDSSDAVFKRKFRVVSVRIRHGRLRNQATRLGQQYDIN